MLVELVITELHKHGLARAYMILLEVKRFFSLCYKRGNWDNRYWYRYSYSANGNQSIWQRRHWDDGPGSKFHAYLGANEIARFNDGTNASGATFQNGSILSQSSKFKLPQHQPIPFPFTRGQRLTP